MLKRNKILLEKSHEYSENNFIFSKIFLLKKKLKIKILKRHKNIPIHKAKIIGIMSLKFPVEKSNKKILHQNVHGANPAINQTKRVPLISFLFSHAEPIQTDGFFIILYDFLIK